MRSACRPIYEAVATVTVEPQVIPDELAPTSIEAKTETRYENLKLQLLARDSLSSIISDFKLFEGDTRSREQQVEAMRKQITLEPLPPAIIDPRKPIELNSFKIAFRHRNPKTAAEVANRLARDFISANLRDRTSLAEGTMEFFDQQLTEGARRPGRHRAAGLRLQGELPGRAARAAPAEPRAARAQPDRARRDRVEGRGRARPGAPDLAADPGAAHRVGVRPDRPEVRKRMLELELNRLLAEGKTEKYPDVVRYAPRSLALDDMIATRADEPAPTSRDEITMRDKLRDYEVDQSVLSGDVERLKADIAEYEQRIENTPRRAAELDHLEAQYKNITEAIRTLQLKQVDAEIGRQIETTSKGERFRVVESAEIPTSPISPNRPVWFVAGTLLGMMLGPGAPGRARDERPDLPQRERPAERARAAGARRGAGAAIPRRRASRACARRCRG